MKKTKSKFLSYGKAREKIKEAGAIKFTKPVVLLPYAEARRYIHQKIIIQFGIDTKNKWSEYTKSGNKPKYIPADPSPKLQRKRLD